MQKKIVQILVVAITTFSFQKASAQLKPVSLGPYVEAGWPASDFSNGYDMGFGGGLGVDIKLPLKFTATGSVGYMQFSGKAPLKDIQAIPIRIGVKYRLAPIYLKVETGVASIMDNGGTAVIFAPGIGFKVAVFDVEGKYESWYKDGSRGFWGIKASVNF